MTRKTVTRFKMLEKIGLGTMRKTPVTDRPSNRAERRALARSLRIKKKDRR